ncbi:MAG TPA: SRPBCC family protein [Acidimicrobiia bacterium]|jgi:hypothetical protein
MTKPSTRWYLRVDEESLVVAAPAGDVYDLVADLTRMGEWSPETAAVEWADGATGPAVGARFVGHNQTGPFGLMRWSRAGTVLVAEPGREFAFATEEGGREGTVWRYRFEPVGAGTRVTESYEVDSIPLWARILDVPTNRAKALRAGMRRTLGQLKTAAESVPTRQ